MTDKDETPWADLSFGIHSGRIDGYLAGHRVGHRAGWSAGFDAGVATARAQDKEFAEMVEQEFHRRELQGESNKTLVRRLLDALRTEENRQRFDERRRAA
ncbi:hypothetical protein [Brevibacterium aurantiacum]|uniref:hypothetical protein n=1 Tax=Brevibacterium aurantiacum TaxID=273384 RepID=UPI003F91FF5E